MIRLALLLTRRIDARSKVRDRDDENASGVMLEQSESDDTFAYYYTSLTSDNGGVSYAYCIKSFSIVIVANILTFLTVPGWNQIVHINLYHICETYQLNYIYL